MLREDPNAVTRFARTNFRRALQPFGIRQRDRRSHMLVIGKTGTGKSTLLKTLLLQDLRAGRGVALFDPHGDLVEEVAANVPENRQRDLVYLNVPDASATWHFNPLGGIPPDRRSLAAAGIVEVFHKLWPDDWGPRLEHVLRNVVFTLLELPGATLGHIPPLLTNRAYRQRSVARITNPAVQRFWKAEYESYSPRFRSVVIAPVLNKVGALLTDPVLRRILIAPESSFDLRHIVDEGQILLVNLSKGRIGEGPSAVLGSLLVSHLALTALSRADLPEEGRRDFLVYLDEYQTFATLSLATMLSEVRKYGFGMVLAHQYLSQVDADVRDAVLGNVGTLVCFRVGARDASFLARELVPVFSSEDLIHLPNYQIYLKLLIGGEPSKAFSAETVANLAGLVVHRGEHVPDPRQSARTRSAESLSPTSPNSLPAVCVRRLDLQASERQPAR